MLFPASARPISISIFFNTVIGSDAGAVKYHTCLFVRSVFLKYSEISWPGLLDEASRSLKSESLSQLGSALDYVSYSVCKPDTMPTYIDFSLVPLGLATSFAFLGC